MVGATYLDVIDGADRRGRRGVRLASASDGEEVPSAGPGALHVRRPLGRTDARRPPSGGLRRGQPVVHPGSGSRAGVGAAGPQAHTGGSPEIGRREEPYVFWLGRRGAAQLPPLDGVLSISERALAIVEIDLTAVGQAFLLLELAASDLELCLPFTDAAFREVHPRLAVVRQPIALGGRGVPRVRPFVSLTFAELRIDLTLVGQAYAQRLLLRRPAFSQVGLRVASLRPGRLEPAGTVSLRCRSIASLGEPLAPVGLTLAHLGVDLTLVGLCLAPADRRVT